MSVFIEKKKRLSNDSISQLEDELEDNPLDYNKWIKLIKQVMVKDKEEQIRNVFTKYLDIFKLDGEQWCKYINFEIGKGDFKKVEELFAKCITTVDNVELFRLYVSYVRRVNDVITGGEKARSTVISAFEFSVNRVGIDVKSGELWNDYSEFLKSWTPSQSWEKQQKIDLIRKLYKKLLVIPTEKVESMWSTYTKWENEVNSSTASRFIADKSAEFMEARAWNIEWNNITDKSLSRKVLPYGLDDSDKDNRKEIEQQLQYWYKWIEFESRNNLNLKDDDLLNKRIEYVYKQAIVSLPFVPELWYRYNQFLMNGPSTEDSNSLNMNIDILSQGLILNPKSYLLSFQLSELYEKETNLAKANEVINNLVNKLIQDHSQIIKQIEEINDKSIVKTQNINGDADNMDEDDVNKPKPGYFLSEHDIKSLKDLKLTEKELSRNITLVYTKLMMTNKRSSGIKESRQIFKQAKKFANIGFELYVENALMEYYSDNKKTANKVFELGLKTYGTNGKYLLAYLDYLIMVNEIESIKVLFEVSITNLLKEIEDPEGVDDMDTPVWIKNENLEKINNHKYFIKRLIKKYGKFATKFLDLGIVTSLEKRFKKYFPEDDELELFRSRYSYDSIDLIKYDLGKSVKYIEQDTRGDIDQFFDYDDETFDKNKRRKLDLPSKPKETAVANQPVIETQNGFIGESIYNLLRILPSASYYGNVEDHVFNSKKLVELFNSLDDIRNQ
ncbi:mRNA 3'-end-processing protein Rna14p [[Candida] jaroonii]|uniref:mRNA 3'-end-processing protein Rna14p n=1 Tax=[Candida] jaroonii TaxID=467808 RepID=A0ACA9Y0A4_9ASCO|nr:mRNA 3'-end-processing protein Rna14p [[Candida] jaroonii]